MSLKNRSVLVTGESGFIGSNHVNTLIQNESDGLADIKSTIGLEEGLKMTIDWHRRALAKD